MEERDLMGKFPAEYRKYREEVPAIIPGPVTLAREARNAISYVFGRGRAIAKEKVEPAISASATSQEARVG